MIEEETSRKVGLVSLLSCVDLVKDSQDWLYLRYEIKYEVNSLSSGRVLGSVHRM